MAVRKCNMFKPLCLSGIKRKLQLQPCNMKQHKRSKFNKLKPRSFSHHNHETNIPQLIDIARNIFKIEIIHHMTQHKFKPRDRTTYEINPRYILDQITIKHHYGTKLYTATCVLNACTLSLKQHLSLDISLISDDRIFAESKQFAVPQSEKLTHRDNGVFCCCGAIYHVKSEYNDTNYNTKSRNNTTRKPRNKITLKVVENSVYIHDGMIRFQFTMNGVSDMDTLIVAEDNIETDGTQWMQCNCCFSWQHAQCIGCVTMTDYYICAFCNDSVFFTKNITSLTSRYVTFINTISKLSSYKRIRFSTNDDGSKYGKRYGDIYMKSRTNIQKIDELSKYTKSQLIQMSYNIGIKMDKKREIKDLAQCILNAPVFAQTPPILSETIAGVNIEGIDKNGEYRICDLCCGNGSITAKIAAKYPNSMIYAFDIDADRIYAAKKLYGDMYTNIIWHHMDILELQFIENEMLLWSSGYDLIIANPAFEIGMECIYVGCELLKRRQNKYGVMVYLLPDGYFDTSCCRKRLARILNFSIKERQCVGQWNYYPTYDEYGNIMERKGGKRSADSIWIMQPWPGIGENVAKQNKWNFDRFSYRTTHPRILDDL